MQEQNNSGLDRKKQKRTVIIILISLLGALALIAGLVSILEGITGASDGEYYTAGPVNPDLLEDTKEEDFDIMEYDEYLKYDRNIYLINTNNGVILSIDESTYQNYGDGFEVMYLVLTYINQGYANAYNSFMGDSELEKESFTQQQIYDIKVSQHSQSTDKGYTEYVFKVEYKIHENNGTYRNNILSDASRPQYFVINNSTGEYLVWDIIEQGIAEKS